MRNQRRPKGRSAPSTERIESKENSEAGMASMVRRTADSMRSACSAYTSKKSSSMLPKFE
jgi:hypothetical protein